jgi:hypothetical protein
LSNTPDLVNVAAAVRASAGVTTALNPIKHKHIQNYRSIVVIVECHADKQSIA